LAAALSTPGEAAAESPECVDLLYFERPPYYQLDVQGQVTGLVAGPAARAFRKAGICYHWLKLPANRHLPRIRKNPQQPVCAVGWFQNSERKKFAQFSLPLYQDKPQVAVARKAAGLKKYYPFAADLLRQKNLVLGLRKGFSYGAHLDAAIARWQPPLYESSRAVSGLLQMLVHRRIDYVFMAREEADYLLRGDASQRLNTIVLGDMPWGNRRYLLCSKNLAESVMTRLNAAIGGE